VYTHHVWPFSNKKASPDLTEVQESIASLKRDFQNLEFEWSNAYDKLRKMMQRVAKRAEVAEKAPDGNDPDPPPSLQMENGQLMPMGGRLNDRQRQIQQQILRRRAGG